MSSFLQGDIWDVTGFRIVILNKINLIFVNLKEKMNVFLIIVQLEFVMTSLLNKMVA